MENNLTLILEPTEAALKRGDGQVSAWNYRAQAWTSVPEWVEWMDEERVNQVWSYALNNTFNPTWATMRVAVKEEVIGYLLANKLRDY